ncbi:MAG: hypothetical protein AAB890_02205 [Patescibacteria group bacterium]
MQDKFIKKNVLEAYLSLKSDVVFLDSSLTKDITFPPRKVIGSFLEIDSMTGGTSTLCVVRYGRDGRDTYLLNIDAFSFKTPTNDNIDEIPLIGHLESFKRSEYHWVNDIPHRDKCPQKYLDRLEEIKDGNLSDSNFLKN